MKLSVNSIRGDGLMKDFDDIVRRFNLIFDEKCLLTRKEAEQLYDDMREFIHENHPIEQKRALYPIGMMESLGMLLDESNDEKTFKFKADK